MTAYLVLIGLPLLGVLSTAAGAYVFATRPLAWRGRVVTRIAIRLGVDLWLFTGLLGILALLNTAITNAKDWPVLAIGIGLFLLSREIMQEPVLAAVFRRTDPKDLILSNGQTATVRQKDGVVKTPDDVWTVQIVYEPTVRLGQCRERDREELAIMAYHISLRHPEWPKHYGATTTIGDGVIIVWAYPTIWLRLLRQLSVVKGR